VVKQLMEEKGEILIEDYLDENIGETTMSGSKIVELEKDEIGR